MTARADSGASIPLPALPRSLVPIENLCSTFSEHVPGQACAGLLAPHSDIVTMYTLHSSLSHLQRHSQTASLKFLLKDSQQKNHLTRRFRYGLALTIASSFLQLHSSPWLTSRWSSDDILFENVNGKVDLSSPRIRAAFDDTAPAVGSFATNESLQSLGIILLELLFGKSITDSPQWQRLLLLDSSSRFAKELVAAQLWSCNVHDEAGPEWSTAITWCVRTRSTMPDPKTWRKELHEIVISGLQKTYQSLTA
jgi:hypothetical protein